jgi:hypothetical protein
MALSSRRRRDEMRDLGDHAAHGGRVLQLGDAADLVEPRPDQRLALESGGGSRCRSARR